MSKKKVKQSTTTIEDHCYRDVVVKKDFFDKIDYEISSILLELSNPVVFSSSNSSPLFHKWGRTKKRTLLNPTVIKSWSVTEVVEMGSTSSSSCLTGEAKKTDKIPTIKKGLEDEFSTKIQNSSQPNTSCSVFELEETGLLRAQVGLRSQPIRDDENLRHLQPLMYADRMANVTEVKTTSLQMDNLERRGFDLNLPATEEGDNSIVAMEGFQRVVIGKIQAAAQARQRRLALIRSKKLYQRFISSHQFK